MRTTHRHVFARKFGVKIVKLTHVRFVRIEKVWGPLLRPLLSFLLGNSVYKLFFRGEEFDLNVNWNLLVLRQTVEVCFNGSSLEFFLEVVVTTRPQLTGYEKKF